MAQAFARFGEDRAGLTQLLAPVERAARASPFVAELFRSRALFEPLAWSPEEAYAFLGSAGDLDGTGLRIRLPKKWKERARRPTAQVRIGELSAGLHARSLLSFEVGLTLDGEPFSAEEMAGLLEGVPRLQLLRGQWVEVDPVALAATLQAWQERSADQVNVPEGLRLLSGLDADPRHPVDVVAGEGLRDVLARLRAPGALEPSPSLEAELRPYQREGLAWLSVISELGLGGCLADDMGLGKTLQVIALLLRRKEQGVAVPALVVVPASLIGNWRAELARFAPSLKVGVAHRSEGAAALDELQQDLSSHDVVISTYGTLGRLPTLVKASWSLVVLDEAQAIKNPTTATARTARSLRAPARLALTGTPIENRLGDLWSLFEFLNPGFLGPEATFLRRMKALAPPQGPGFAPLRRLVRPYLLRRLKSDRRIIKDLPDKTELTTRCPLSRRQAALYADSVKALEKALHATEGPKRRGLVLALLTRFKQICNHPSQWLQDGEYRPEDSGKMGVLRDIAETARDRQDKILVFTQFRAMTEPLHAFLTEVFGAPGLILHGGTPT
ncbi:MAG: SNF2-related protein, partial [Myxococcota bacterium]